MVLMFIVFMLESKMKAALKFWVFLGEREGDLT